MLVRIIASLFIIPLIAGVILLLITLRANKLKRGRDESDYQKQINEKNIEKLFLEEISYNQYSIKANDKILDSQNKKYNKGIFLIITAIILSLFLLILDTLFKEDTRENNPIILSTMENAEKQDGTQEPKQDPEIIPSETRTLLPNVDPSKVKELNEGVDQKEGAKKDSGR